MREVLAGWADNFEALVAQYSDVRTSGRNRIALTESQQETASSAVQRMRSTFLMNVGAIAVRRVEGESVAYRDLGTGQQA